MIVTCDEEHGNPQQEGEEEVIQSGFWFRSDFTMVFNADLLGPSFSFPCSFSRQFRDITASLVATPLSGDGSTFLRPPCFSSPSKHVEDPTKRLKSI